MTMEEKHFAFSILDEKIHDNYWLSPSIKELQQEGRADEVALMSYPDMEWLGDSDTVIDERHEITVIIDYPLNKPCNLHISGSGPVTVSRFCKAVSDMYRMIYKEEARTSSLPERNIRGMLNRASTDGKYGIWGHHSGDLYLEGAVLRKDGAWKLLMGS